MRGSKKTSMTLAEMRAARERGESRTDWERVRRAEAAGIEPQPDRDSPDASRLMRKLLRRGRPRLENPRELLTLRLPPDVIARWRATGPGWQTRMAETLESAIKRQHTVRGALATPYEAYQRIDLGPGGYAKGPSRGRKRTVRAAIAQKHGRQS